MSPAGLFPKSGPKVPVLLLRVPAAHPILFVAGAAASSLGLVGGSTAEAVDEGEDDPAVVPDRMIVGKNH